MVGNEYKNVEYKKSYVYVCLMLLGASVAFIGPFKVNREEVKLPIFSGPINSEKISPDIPPKYAYKSLGVRAE
jgi:hypothetical protein